jgi:hypothetical protein
MTSDETIDLLSVAAAFDRRTTGESDVIAWHAAIGDLDFIDSRAAVIAHYRESRDWVMPADVRNRVKAMRRDRLAREIQSAPGAELAAEPGRYKAELDANIRRIANGRTAWLAIAAPVREGPPPEEFTEARKARGPALPSRHARPLSPEDLALQQAAESRAARAAEASEARREAS